MKIKKILKKNILISLVLVCSIININTVFATNHTHNDDCYNGTKHICSGDEVFGGGCYTKKIETPHTHNNNCYVSKLSDCSHNLTLNNLVIMDIYKCPKCNKEDFFGYKTSCSCDGTTHEVYAGDCLCGYMGNATIGAIMEDDKPPVLNFTHTKSQETLNCTKTYDKILYEKNCNKINNTYYDANRKVVSPICSKIVTKIEPKVAEQKTNNPDFTIIVTYLDGHTIETLPSTTNYNNSKSYTNEKIDLSYNCVTNKDGSTTTLKTTFVLTTNRQPSTTPRPTVTVTTTPTNLPTQRPVVTPTPRPTIIVTPPIVIVTETPTQIPTKTPTQTPTTKPTTTPTPIVSIIIDAENMSPNETTITPTNVPTIVEKEDIIETPIPTEEIKKDEELNIDVVENENKDKEDINKEIDDETKVDVEENEDETPIFVYIAIIILVVLIIITTIVLFLLLKKNKGNSDNNNDNNSDNNYYPNTFGNNNNETINDVKNETIEDIDVEPPQ